uniref:Multimerin 2 n=1 Tax=Leptobrachium leishanense TaxID=445787 RepID=A0A8C5Q6Y9_9ANUR
MEGRLCLLAFSLGMMKMVMSSPHRHIYDGSLSVGSRMETHGSSTYSHGLPGYDGNEEAKGGLDDDLLQMPTTTPPVTRDRSSREVDQSKPRRGNWCSFVRSRVVTYADLCKTEKYVIKSQLPCPDGTPNCQKTMYRLAQKPVYELKRKALTSLEWRCCNGYTGAQCEHKDPNAIHIPEEFAVKQETQEEPAVNPEAEEILEDVQSQELLVENIQNDIHQTSTNLLELQSVLENNITIIRNESEARYGIGDRLLQEVFLPHVENFLKEHFNPMFTSFNKSLQNLSNIVKNLSENVESDRKRLDRFLEDSMAKRDLHELGSKFESKVQENMIKLEQMKQEMSNQFHTVQAGIHYNLTMVKAETDIKFKRNQKLLQSQFSQYNLSISDLRREQEQFQDELQDITQNITELWETCSSKDRDTTSVIIPQLNETLIEYERQIKDLYTESDAAFENISTLEKWFKELRTEYKKNSDEVRVSFIEKSLIMEENKDFLLRQMMELNYTLAGIQESSDELFRNCDCQKMTMDILSLEEVQRNFSNLYKDILYGIEDVKQKEGSSKTSLENSFEDLSLALDLNRLSLTAQQEQGRNLISLTARLQAQANNVSGDVDFLKKMNDHILDHIRLLNSSFSSLLEDATRHDKALEALLGEELLEVFSEETPELLQMSVLQIYDMLNETRHRLEIQQKTTISLIERMHLLENQPQRKDYLDPNSIFNVEHQLQGVTNDRPFKDMATTDGSKEYEDGASSDITTLKDDIKHLSHKIKRLESFLSDRHSFKNDNILNTLNPMNISLSSMKLEMASLREHFGRHIETFRKLFGNYETLISSNVPLDLAKVHAVLDKKVKKKCGDPKPRKSNELQSDSSAEHSLSQDSYVAFAASFTNGAEAVSILKFNTVLLDHGNVFDPVEKDFTAPYNGVYALAISVDFSPGRALGQLLCGGQEKLVLQTVSIQDGEGSKHGFVVVELKEGDKVWFFLLQGSVKKNSSGTVLSGYLIFKT